MTNPSPYLCQVCDRERNDCTCSSYTAGITEMADRAYLEELEAVAGAGRHEEQRQRSLTSAGSSSLSLREQIEQLAAKKATSGSRALRRAVALQAARLTLDAVEAKLLELRDGLTGEELFALDELRAQLTVSPSPESYACGCTCGAMLSNGEPHRTGCLIPSPPAEPTP